MNDITRMAREAGLFVPQAGIPENGALTRFAALVRADEREQCAKVFDPNETDDAMDQIVKAKCAVAIRARGAGMNRDNIIRMARSAIRLAAKDTDLTNFDQEATIIDRYQFLYWFAKEVAAAEQNRCCKIVYGMAGSDNAAQRTVDAIRGET